MESTQQQQQGAADIQHHHHHQGDLGNKNINGSGGYACSMSSSRQSSSRWTPTSDQIRILKELYYTNGIRSPTADQIQRIAAQLRQYGKIEGKNVFYWFQNHKARERQKKRFTPPAAAPSSSYAPPPPPFSDHHHLTTPAMQIQSHHHQYYHHHQEPQPQPPPPPPPPPHVYGHPHKLYTTHHIGVGSGSSSSQAGLMAVGCGYGSVAMEKSFRECSISPPGESRARIGGNFGPRSSRVGGVDSSCSNLFDKMMKPKTSYDHHILSSENHHCEDELDEEEGEEGYQSSREIETLPLFPIHDHEFFSIKTTSSSENNNASGGGGGNYYTGGNWYRSDARASLELSLSTYYGGGYYYN